MDLLHYHMFKYKYSGLLAAIDEEMCNNKEQDLVNCDGGIQEDIIRLQRYHMVAFQQSYMIISVFAS